MNHLLAFLDSLGRYWIDGMTAINPVLWVLSNMLLAISFAGSFIFAVLYTVLGNPTATTAGIRIRRAFFSIAGLGLLSFLGIFIDGQVPWTQMPETVGLWRPVVRFAVYAFVSYSVVSLIHLVIARRFFPERLRTAPDDWDFTNRGGRNPSDTA